MYTCKQVLKTPKATSPFAMDVYSMFIILPAIVIGKTHVTSCTSLYETISGSALITVLCFRLVLRILVTWGSTRAGILSPFGTIVFLLMVGITNGDDNRNGVDIFI